MSLSIPYKRHSHSSSAGSPVILRLGSIYTREQNTSKSRLSSVSLSYVMKFNILFFSRTRSIELKKKGKAMKTRRNLGALQDGSRRPAKRLSTFPRTCTLRHTLIKHVDAWLLQHFFFPAKECDPEQLGCVIRERSSRQSSKYRSPSAVVNIPFCVFPTTCM